MAIKISSLELENVKRVKAVSIEPALSGLTIIGGDNGQGKTSVLDAIAWALGGEKYRPSNAAREGSTIPPHLKVTLSNGLIAERKGKNSDLTVYDPSGNRAGQQLLNSFIEQFALDLPKFMAASSADKAKTLLNIIGVGSELAKLELAEKRLYEERLAIGRIADQKEKHAKELPTYDGVPAEPVSASELIREQQEILARNGMREQWRREHDKLLDEDMRLDDEIERMKQKISELTARRNEVRERIRETDKSPAEMKMESTAELEQSIADIELINAKVRTNLDKARAEDEARQFHAQYDALTDQIQSVRTEKLMLLDGADLPLPGLSVCDGELTYNGKSWDCTSGSDQLRVATAIVRKLNPECGFVLIDKLEQMDMTTLNSFGEWLKSEGLQAITTRVSTGSECSIIISDGYAVEITEKTEAPSEPEGGYWS